MSFNNKSKDIVRPDVSYWKAMRIDAEKVLERLTEQKAYTSMSKFRLEDLKEFYRLQTGRDPSSLTKHDFSDFLLRREPALVNTLFIIEQYSRWTEKATLQGFCEKNGLAVEGRTRTQMALLLFNHKPDMLRKVRVVSIGNRIQSNYVFSGASSKVTADIAEKAVVDRIASAIEDKLSTQEQRAKLIEHHFDQDEGSYNLYVKHESRVHHVEEWDSSHWDKPVNWLVAHYSPKKHFLTIRCKDETRARAVAAIVSQQLTGSEDSFKQQDFEQWRKPTDVREIPQVPEKEGFRVADVDIKALTIQNTKIKNAPTIRMRGYKLNESLADLEEKLGFAICARADITAREITVKFEFEGVAHETTVKFASGKRNAGFSKGVSERVKKHLLDYLAGLFEEK